MVSGIIVMVAQALIEKGTEKVGWMVTLAIVPTVLSFYHLRHFIFKDKLEDLPHGCEHGVEEAELVVRQALLAAE